MSSTLKMIDYAAIIKENPNGVLATRDGEKIKTRVFHCVFVENDRAYFTTAADRTVYAQMQQYPNVSFCTYPKNYSPVLSLIGKVIFVDDIALKKKILDENAMFKKMYQSPDNPNFKIFYIEIEEIRAFSAAEGLKSYKQNKKEQ